MQIISVTQILSDNELSAPNLNALNPNQDNYTTLLLQPEGDIEVGSSGVRNADRLTAKRRFAAFLADAIHLQADLVVTPEYSMPWEVLEEAITNGSTPRAGALWVIGCESTTIQELEALSNRLSATATFIFEPVEPNTGRFLDPVAYVFLTSKSDSDIADHLVIVVQFKTFPMGDDDHFEINGLQLGTRLYCFGNATTQLRLATLICSDAFAFLDSHAQEIYDRTLLIHIQLNPKPRQDQYRQYRTRLLQYGGDQTEVICLNWAKNVYENHGGSRQCWDNISGSAWYLRPDKFDYRDATLTTNHTKGLYFTWLKALRCNALFFNYLPASYLITATKVAHIAVPASVSRRRGPQVTAVRTWDDSSSSWMRRGVIDDGFSSIVKQCGNAESAIAGLAATNPFHAERALALCAGEISSHYDWHAVTHLDSCAIEPSEVVCRITACQDTDPDASRFRIQRLRSCQRVATILLSSLPTALLDLQAGFQIDWTPDSPHTNIAATSGRRATAIHLGNAYTAETAQRVADLAADYIGRWASEPNDILEARQRLHVWYQDQGGQDVLCDRDRYVGFDDPHSDSPFDIARSK